MLRMLLRHIERFQDQIEISDAKGRRRRGSHKLRPAAKATLTNVLQRNHFVWALTISVGASLPLACCSGAGHGPVATLKSPAGQM